MNKMHEPSEEELARLCREVVRLSRASEEDIHAAANAPFLYARLRTRITEAEARAAALTEPRANRWLWQWRWALAFVVIAVLAGLSWRWMQSRPQETRLVQQHRTTSPIVAETNEEKAPTAAAPQPQPLQKATAKPMKKRRALPVVIQDTEQDEIEVATDFLPLTYVASSDERSGQVVRVEMPRSAMLALGLPVNQEASGELVKADVLVRDDGLALAIRFVR